MFLLNSWLNHFIESRLRGIALSRSYSYNLPSSFSAAHPSALEYSSRLPVSVCGTSCYNHNLEVFLVSRIRVTLFGRSLRVLSRSTQPTDLPIGRISTRFNGNFRCPADCSLLRHPIEVITSTGILTSFPSTSPFGFA